jgi:hypothetical protein
MNEEEAVASRDRSQIVEEAVDTVFDQDHDKLEWLVRVQLLVAVLI